MLGVQDASHGVGFWGVVGRDWPLKLVLGEVHVPPELPLVYSRHAEKAPGLSAGLGAHTEPQGAQGGGISSQARLGCAARGPAQGSLLWPPLQAGSVLPPRLPASHRQPCPLMEERCCEYTAAPRLSCRAPAPCRLRQQHGVGSLCLWLGLLQEGVVSAKTSEPVEAGMRTCCFGFTCLFCQQRKILALFSCIKCFFL